MQTSIPLEVIVMDSIKPKGNDGNNLNNNKQQRHPYMFLIVLFQEPSVTESTYMNTRADIRSNLVQLE